MTPTPPPTDSARKPAPPAASTRGAPPGAPQPDEFGPAMLAWVALLLRRQIARARLTGLLPPTSSGDAFAGAFVSEVDATTAGRSVVVDSAGGRPPPQPEEIAQLDASLEQMRASLHLQLVSLQGIPLGESSVPLATLWERFGLADDEFDLLMIVLAAALDARIRRLLAYLQNDVARRRPEAGTALSMLLPSGGGARLAWQLLKPDGALRFFNLIVVPASDRTERERATWLLERPLSVPDAVAAYIVRGTPWLDDSIAPFTRVVDPKQDFADLPYSDEDRALLRAWLTRASTAVREDQPAPGLLLRGAVGSGRKTAIGALCRTQRLRLLVVDARLLPSDEDGASSALRTALRDARLHDAALVIEHADALSRDSAAGLARLQAVAAMYRQTRHRGGTLIFFTAEGGERLPIEEELGVASVSLPSPSSAGRFALWRRLLPAPLPDDDVRFLAGQFPTLPGVMVAAAQDIVARLQAGRSSGGPPAVAPISRPDLARQVLDRSRHNLHAIASPVPSVHRWDDVILPPDILDRCRRIEQLVQVQDDLAGRWGVGAKLMPHRGVSALFSGPPGVGKTMVAAIIGHSLGFEVFRIDISRVLSKWVGETEKNLSRVFDEASRTRAVLIFDEADALFAKRTDVKNASDRYSNVEVNFLLQQLERFDGIVILTTNLEKSIDEAFVRRLNFKIRFPEPTEEEREQMWRRMIPPEIKLTDDVNMNELAKKFDVTGGFIRNAIIRAAVIGRLRSPDRVRLSRRDLLQAVSEELQENGRLG